MIRVGLTGGIGSGKSTVAHILSLEGVPVYAADDRSKWLLEHDPAVVSAVKSLLGPTAYLNDKPDRKAIAALVFSNPQLLKELNHIVHPTVSADFERWCSEQGDVAYVVEESAILFESGADRRMDYVVTVTAPEAVRIARTILRDGVPEEAVRQRIHNQMSEEERLVRSNYRIYSDEKELLIPQVLALHQQLLEQAQNRSEKEI